MRPLKGMSLRGCLAVALLVFTPGVWALESLSALQLDVASKDARPVTKVIALLQDMLKQLEKEGDQDKETYDKMACWCQTNEAIKTKSIADNEAIIQEATSNIEKFNAEIFQLRHDVRRIEEQVAEDQQALKTATSLREKQLAEFQDEETDYVTTIGALKAAVVVLEKHSAHFMQMPSNVKVIATAMQKAMQQHGNVLKGVISPSEREVLTSFLQVVQPDGAPSMHSQLLQSSGPYDHQSGQIFGIINQMKESFEINLATAQKDELERAKEYGELKAAQEEQIKAGEEKRQTKRGALASKEQDLAEAKADKKIAEETLFADEQFLKSLKSKCKVADKEWEERQKERSAEMEAVSGAVAVLSTDEAHDTFAKALPPTFLQDMEAAKKKRHRHHRHRHDRDQAAMLLSDVALRVHNPNLAALATRVRLDAFTEVKKAIDQMVEELSKQQADEVKMKDSCTSWFQENKLATEKKTREKAITEQDLIQLQSKLDDLTAKMKSLTAEIADMKDQIKRAGEDRNFEHIDFLKTLEDERNAQNLLTAALKILQRYYIKSRASLVLQQEGIGQEPPPGLDAYKAQSKAVLGMIEKIIEHAKKLENDALVAESDAQKAYEDFVKESNLGIDARTDAFNEAKGTKAKTMEDFLAAKAENEDQLKELKQLSDQKSNLHDSCDYVLNNFDARQKSRGEEIESLRKAKGILTGAKSLFQKKEHSH